MRLRLRRLHLTLWRNLHLRLLRRGCVDCGVFRRVIEMDVQQAVSRAVSHRLNHRLNGRFRREANFVAAVAQVVQAERNDGYRLAAIERKLHGKGKRHDAVRGLEVAHRFQQGSETACADVRVARLSHGLVAEVHHIQLMLRVVCQHDNGALAVVTLHETCRGRAVEFLVRERIAGKRLGRDAGLFALVVGTVIEDVVELRIDRNDMHIQRQFRKLHRFSAAFGDVEAVAFEGDAVRRVGRESGCLLPLRGDFRGEVGVHLRDWHVDVAKGDDLVCHGNYSGLVKKRVKRICVGRKVWFPRSVRTDWQLAGEALVVRQARGEHSAPAHVSRTPAAG